MLGDDSEKRGKGYDAYTQPADSENAPYYSFSYDPKRQPPQNEEEGREPPKKRHRGRMVGAVAVVLAIVILAAASVWFFTSYSVKIDTEDGVVSIRLIPAGTPEEAPEVYMPDSSPEPSTAPDASGDRDDVQWDGTTLEIGPAQSQTGEGAADGTLTYQQVYSKCAPSVVVITTTTDSEAYTGTGVIMSQDGYIITCSHLVSADATISVMLNDGTEYDSVLIGQDDQTDLAVLKIEAKNLTKAEFGDSDSLQVGEEVVAIGNPMGQNLTMTNGILSAIDRNVERNGYTMTLLQTNAAINEGNSGGPLINMSGQIVGITNMKMMSYYSTVEGIGFAIPISSAKAVVDELLQHGYIAGRPAIGIIPSNIPGTAAAYYRLPEGVFVDYVYENTDAYAKGLRRGDIITAIDDEAITSTDDMNLIKAGYVAGDTVTLTLYRDGEYLTVEIILSDLALLGN